ncbi:hypothetical protein BGZ93_007117 [Podila epicladia]|nr:hypothetical protein BGZ92_007921 [Podila epicladia]KAG0094517.1 hypothetical protein BGZ93_007117 [Podila epicladia]
MSHGNRVDNYGVWVGTPSSFRMETVEEDPHTPHIYLKFTDNSNNRNLEAAINVKSKQEESRLVFWVKRQFLHPIVNDLSRLDKRFHSLPDRQVLSLDGLDYIRTPGLIFPSRGILLEHDVPGPHNDMLNVMEPILKRAIKEKATVYIFGSRFERGHGIHEVHMNQGSLQQFSNDVNKDGALIIQFEDHWEAVFLAFGSQKVPTDDVKGLSLTKSESLAEQLGYNPVIPERTF